MKDDRDGNFIISNWPLPKTKRFKMENIVGLALRSLIHLFGFGIALSVTPKMSADSFVNCQLYSLILRCLKFFVRFLNCFRIHGLPRIKISSERIEYFCNERLKVYHLTQDTIRKSYDFCHFLHLSLHKRASNAGKVRNSWMNVPAASAKQKPNGRSKKIAISIDRKLI